MVIGIGLDLVEVARVERVLARYGERFVDKLMDRAEAGRLPAEATARAGAVALAVAAKEAASKALGTGWSQGVRWRDVEVDLAASPGCSTLRLAARAAEVAAEQGSSGRTRVKLERRGPLVIGEVWLLS